MNKKTILTIAVSVIAIVIAAVITDEYRYWREKKRQQKLKQQNN